MQDPAAFVETWQCIVSTGKQFFSLSEASSCCGSSLFLVLWVILLCQNSSGRFNMGKETPCPTTEKVLLMHGSRAVTHFSGSVMACSHKFRCGQDFCSIFYFWRACGHPAQSFQPLPIPFLTLVVPLRNVMHFPKPSIYVYFRTNMQSQVSVISVSSAGIWMSLTSISTSISTSSGQRKWVHWPLSSWSSQQRTNLQRSSASLCSHFPPPPPQLLASQNTMMTGSIPCYFGAYQTLVSSVSFLIQFLS